MNAVKGTGIIGVKCMNKDVSIVRCDEYSPEECRRALEEVLAPVGGLSWVRSGMTVAVKANLVAPIKPERAATTHPVLLCELTKMLTERGARMIIGDSPGGLYNSTYLSHVYDVTGLRLCEAAGAVLNGDFSQKQGSFPEARQAKTFQYTAWLDGADALIDFCKLKTHGQMGMSAAVKNLFGTVPGTMKPEYHYKYPNSWDFADMLVDLYEFFKPRLCICDAVIGMEGNGPTQGTARRIGAVLASANGHALDMAAAEILGFKPADIPTLAVAIARGLCPASAEELNVYGGIAGFMLKDVKKTPAQQSVFFSVGRGGAVSRAVDGLLHKILTPFPQLHAGQCVGCGKCANICPAKAIVMAEGKPRINRKKCIRCFCCQEFCPVGAMQVGRTAVARLLNK